MGIHRICRWVACVACCAGAVAGGWVFILSNPHGSTGQYWTYHSMYGAESAKNVAPGLTVTNNTWGSGTVGTGYKVSVIGPGNRYYATSVDPGTYYITLDGTGDPPATGPSHIKQCYQNAGEVPVTYNVHVLGQDYPSGVVLPGDQFCLDYTGPNDGSKPTITMTATDSAGKTRPVETIEGSDSRWNAQQPPGPVTDDGTDFGGFKGSMDLPPVQDGTESDGPWAREGTLRAVGNSLADGIKGLTAPVNHVGNTMYLHQDATTAAVNAVAAAVAGTTAAVNGVGSKVDAMNSNLASKLDGANSTLGAMSGKMDTANTKLGSIDTGIATGNTKLGQIKDGIDSATNILGQVARTNNLTASILDGLTNALGKDRRTIPGYQDPKTQGENAVASAKAEMEGWGNVLGTADFVYVPDMPNQWNITLSGHEYDFNPMNKPWFASIAASVKKIFTWFLAAAFLAVIVNITFDGIRSLGAANSQTSASVIPGVSSGVAAAMAVICVAAFGLIPAAFMLAVEGAFSGMRDSVSAGNPFTGGSGPFQAAVYILDAFVPVTMVCLSVVWAILYRITVTTALLTAQSIIRFAFGCVVLGLFWQAQAGRLEVQNWGTSAVEVVIGTSNVFTVPAAGRCVLDEELWGTRPGAVEVRSQVGAEMVPWSDDSLEVLVGNGGATWQDRRGRVYWFTTGLFWGAGWRVVSWVISMVKAAGRVTGEI